MTDFIRTPDANFADLADFPYRLTITPGRTCGCTTWTRVPGTRR